MHSKQLTECHDGTGTDCAACKGELSDMTHYHAFLSEALRSDGLVGLTGSPGAVASSALATLHNMVTESIDAKWQGERRRFYCAQHVLDSVPQHFVADVGSPGLALGHRDLPGLAQSHRVVQC